MSEALAFFFMVSVFVLAATSAGMLGYLKNIEGYVKEIRNKLETK